LVALTIGVVVYVTGRPPGSASLLPAAFSISGGASHLFGGLGGSLPDFLHALAFTVLTAVVLGGSRTAALASAAAWWSIDSLFEIGQHPAVSPWLVAALPTWFGHIPLLGNTDKYFLRGTFDPADLAAIAIGCGCAAVLCPLLAAGRRSP
jgi:hypothetical protein